MALHFNVKGNIRKAMVKAIEQELGCRAKYLGAPSYAYEIGAYRVEKDGTLSWPDAYDDEYIEHISEIGNVADACVMATGQSPEEWDNVEVEDWNNVEEDVVGEEKNEDPELGVTIPHQ